MKIFWTLLLALGSTPLFAQDFSLFYEPETASDYIIIRDVYPTSDEHILAGYDLMSGGMPAAGLMKTDMDGYVLWSKILEIPASLAGCTFEVVENAEGNYYLWGLSKEAETNNMRAILSEITADGEMLWSKEYDFGFNLTTSYTINKLAILPSGDLQMMIAVYDEVIVMKTTADGEIIWGKSSAMGPPDDGGKNPGFEWLAIPDDGGMCASKAENDFSLLRYSEDGELLWNKAYKLGTYTHGKTITRSTNGNILVAGFVNFVPHIMEISDEDGTLLWAKRFETLNMLLTSKAHLSVVDEKIILDMTTSSNEQYIVELSETGDVVKTMKSKYPVFDYNKLEFVANGQDYFYGGVLVDGENKGMIHRTDDLLGETCLIETAEPLVTTEFTDFSEVAFTPFETDFTSEEPMEITLIDLPLRAKYACDVILTTPEENRSGLMVFPTPSEGQITLKADASLLGSEIHVSTMAGQLIEKSVLMTFNQVLNLSHLPNGQYLITLINEENVVTEKIKILH